MNGAILNLPIYDMAINLEVFGPLMKYLCYYEPSGKLICYHDKLQLIEKKRESIKVWFYNFHIAVNMVFDIINLSPSYKFLTNR